METVTHTFTPMTLSEFRKQYPNRAYLHEGCCSEADGYLVTVTTPEEGKGGWGYPGTEGWIACEGYQHMFSNWPFSI